MKQETLEEFAERLCPNKQVEYDCILEGAKWQQEKIYNLIRELYDNEHITGFSKRAYAQCLDIVESFKQ